MKKLLFILVIIFLSLSIIGCGGKDRKELVKESTFHPEGKFVKLNNRETYLVEKGQGQPLILIHGFGASIYSWRNIIDPLAEEYHVYAIDLLGFGYSAKPDIDYNLQLYTDQVEALIDKYNLDSVTLIGNSLGGKISANLAIQKPDKVESLVLIDAAGYEMEKNNTPLLFQLAKVPGVRKILALFNSKKRIRKILEGVYYDDKKVTEQVVEAYYRPYKTKGALRAPMALLNGGMKKEGFSSKIKEITAPSLIIWGEEDQWIPLRKGYKYHQDIPDSKLIVLTHAGHVPQEEVPEIVATSVLEFLNKIKNKKGKLD